MRVAFLVLRGLQLAGCMRCALRFNIVALQQMLHVLLQEPHNDRKTKWFKQGRPAISQFLS